MSILKDIFIGYHILFTKHKKLFLFWRNRLFANTLIFADVWLHQQKLDNLWQQTIYQEISFDSISQVLRAD